MIISHNFDLVQISNMIICWSKLWFCMTEIVNIVWSKLCICVGQNCEYYLIKIVNTCCSKLWIFVVQKLWLSVHQNCEYRWIKNVSFVWIKIIYTGWCRTFVEISTKLRHRCRSVVEFWYKFRPNFDQTSAKPRHPQCRSFVEVCSTYKCNTF